MAPAVTFAAGPVAKAAAEVVRSALHLTDSDHAGLLLAPDAANPDAQPSRYWARRDDGQAASHGRGPVAPLAALMATVLHSGQELAGNAQDGAGALRRGRSSQIRAYLVLPLQATSSSRTVGALSLCRFLTRPYDERERQLAGYLASHAAIAVAHLHQREQLQRQEALAEARLREQQLVASTTAAIAASGELEGALRALIEGMQALTGCDSGGVRLLPEGDPGAGPCRLYSWYGGQEYGWLELVNLPGSNTVAVLELGRGVYTPNLRDLAGAANDWASIAVERRGLASSLIVPLRAGGRTIGTLHADSRLPNAFSDAQLIPLQVLADQAGGAIARVRLEEAEREAGRARDAALAGQARADGAIRTGRAVAHELGSPLGAILALTELLGMDARLPEDVRQDLRDLRQQALRARVLLQQIGRITRYEEMATPVGPQLDLGRASSPGYLDSD